MKLTNGPWLLEHVEPLRGTHGRLDVALVNEEAFRQWRGQYWMDLLGAYLGAPVKEVYPITILERP